MFSQAPESYYLEDSEAFQEARGLTRLHLTNFRNYSTLRLQLAPSPVILTGSNGAGKTNLLEAVSLLSPGRGIRNAKLSEITCFFKNEGDLLGETYPLWAIAATIETGQGLLDIGTGLDQTAEGKEKRILRVQGEHVGNQGALSQYLSILWLTPQMDGLLREGLSARRRFLDRLVFTQDPQHATRVNRYEHVMRERARLLQERKADTHWLQALEERMAEETVAIAAARLTLVQQLEEAKAWTLGCFPRAHLRLLGTAEESLKTLRALEVEDRLKSLLKDNRALDARTGKTHEGAHRCDLEVFFPEKGVLAALCSTGEQKALLVSIVMAAIKLQALKEETVPLLLLDEVMAHLDAQRRRALFEEILHLNLQAWMTGTDESLFPFPKGQAQNFHVEKGTVLPV